MIHVARLRTAARFLIRSLDPRGASFLLALGAVVVGVSIASTVLDLKADIVRKMSREFRAYGPNLIVTPAPGRAGAGLTGEVIAALPSFAGGPSVLICPILYAGGQVGEAGVTLAGIEIDAARAIFPFWRLDGSWPEARDERACLIGSALASRLGARPGSAVTIVVNGQSATLTTSALVSTGESEEDQLFLPLSLLRRLTGDACASVVALRVDGGPERIGSAAARLGSSGLPITAMPLRQVAEGEGRLLGRLDLMMLLLTALILSMSILCVMTTLFSVVVEREREIGLLRALGAGDGEILLILGGEATILGLIGGALGFVLGAINARALGVQLFGTAVDARPEVIPAALALAVLVCWAGVLLPLRRALAINPSAALRGE